MQTIRPARGYLFCKPEEAIKKTASGILLSENSAEKPKIAEVINIGADVKDVKQKDNIVYKSYATSEVKIDGEEYFLIAQDDVLGFIVDY